MVRKYYYALGYFTLSCASKWEANVLPTNSITKFLFIGGGGHKKGTVKKDTALNKKREAMSFQFSYDEIGNIEDYHLVTWLRC